MLGTLNNNSAKFLSYFEEQLSSRMQGCAFFQVYGFESFKSPDCPMSYWSLKRDPFKR